MAESKPLQTEAPKLQTQSGAALKNKFAVVNKWDLYEMPEFERATLTKLQIAARDLDLSCIEITPDGKCLQTGKQMTNTDVDFAICLLFDCPKSYDIFSFYPAWTPLSRFFANDYRASTGKVLSHDDILSPLSSPLEDHFFRNTLKDSLHLPPRFTCLASPPSSLALEPVSQTRKLMYVDSSQSDQQLDYSRPHLPETLKILADKELLTLYKMEASISQYQNHESNVLPDTVFAIREMHKNGVVLCLSAAEQLQSGLMDYRLFEAIVAGALVICDDHPLIRQHFSDLLLYVRPKDGGKEMAMQIETHLQWINTHPEEATAKAREAQQIYKQKFALDVALKEIYDSLPERKSTLQPSILNSNENPKVQIFCLLFEASSEGVERLLSNCRNQDYDNKHVTFVMEEDPATLKLIGIELDKASIAHDFVEIRNLRKHLPNRLGKILSEALLGSLNEDCQYFNILTNYEHIHSNHLSALISLMQENKHFVSATAEILQDLDPNIPPPNQHVDHDLSFQGNLRTRSVGFARFIFAKEILAQPGTQNLLPYTHRKFLQALIGDNEITCSRLVTVVTDTSAAVFQMPVNAIEEYILAGPASVK